MQAQASSSFQIKDNEINPYICLVKKFKITVHT